MPNPNFPNNPGYNLYVGARYVPIFSDVNNGVWTDSVAYEPLTIVTYLGDSYTSKTYVPAGIAPTNETYWAKTGNYNAQIETLNQKINSVEQSVTSLDGEVAQIDLELENLSTSTSQSISNITSDVSTLQSTVKNNLIGKKVVLIADSLGANGFASSLQAILECDMLNLSNGGMGFIATGSSSPWKGKNALATLTAGISSLTPNERKKYCTLIVGLGTNDCVSTNSPSQLQTAIQEFFTYAKTMLPNADICFWFDTTFSPFNVAVRNDRIAALPFMEAAYETASNLGVRNMVNLSYVPLDYVEWKSTADNIHMSDTGYSEYAKRIAVEVLGGNCIIPHVFTTPPTITLPADIGISGGSFVRCNLYIERGIIHFNFRINGFTATSDPGKYYSQFVMFPNLASYTVMSERVVPQYGTLLIYQNPNTQWIANLDITGAVRIPKVLEDPAELIIRSHTQLFGSITADTSIV